MKTAVILQVLLLFFAFASNNCIWNVICCILLLNYHLILNVDINQLVF